MELFVFIIILAIIVVIIQVTVQSKYAKKESDKFECFKKELETKYGAASNQIFLIPEYTSTTNVVLVFPNYEKIVIEGCTHDFSNIMDFTVNEEKSYKSNTSTSSAIGRGIVGGVLLGGVGALAGATTAKKKTVEKVEGYTIRLTMQGFNNSDVTMYTKYESTMRQITSILKKIIDHNEKKPEI